MAALESFALRYLWHSPSAFFSTVDFRPSHSLSRSIHPCPRQVVVKPAIRPSESQQLEISKTLAFLISYDGSSGANFNKARFRELHTYRLSVISEKKKAKEPL